MAAMRSSATSPTGPRRSRTSPTELEEAEAIGEDHVLALGRVAGRARASGVETELRLAVLYTVRGGRIVRGREYMTKDEALAAASQLDTS